MRYLATNGVYLLLNKAHLMKKAGRVAKKPEVSIEDKAFRIEIGKRILITLEDKGWDQTELARQLGMDRSKLNRWINGHTSYELNDLRKIAKALSTSVAYLSGEKESGFEVVDLEDKAYQAYKILKGLDPKIQNHYLFVFDAIEHHERSRTLSPSL
jgi:transcriptional regulator with XRE-family HTH domain